ncbi:hypothetical protein Tco_0914493 [Tanacetum coccineum]
MEDDKEIDEHEEAEEDDEAEMKKHMEIQKMNIKFRGGLLGLKDFKIILRVTTTQYLVAIKVPTVSLSLGDKDVEVRIDRITEIKTTQRQLETSQLVASGERASLVERIRSLRLEYLKVHRDRDDIRRRHRRLESYVERHLGFHP